MAEKESAKKWLALLLVLVVLSLVVDLLSLNVLYNIADSDSNLKGDLALTYRYRSSNIGSGCYQSSVSGYTRGSCMDGCFNSFGNCIFNACESEYSCKRSCGDDSVCENECEEERSAEDYGCEIDKYQCEDRC